MDAARHIELLRVEGGRLASMPADALAAPVPALPDWTVERVLRHTAKVHQWATAILRATPQLDVAASRADLPAIPKGPGCLPAYRDALDAVLAAFDDVDPDDAKWTFMGAGDVRFWARRQALEVMVHRMDAADAVHAAGGAAPEPIDADGAADAIDEWARLFLANRWARGNDEFPTDLEGRTIHIHGTDDPPPPDGAEWLLTFTEGRVDVAATHAKGDTALRGRAQDLLLTLWRRRPLDTLDVIGDRSLAEQVLDLARF